MAPTRRVPRRRPALLTTAELPAARRWRVIGAVAVVVCAAVHLYLYGAESYRDIPTVGPLFLLTGVAGVVLAGAVLAARRPVTDLAGAGFALSVLGAYLLTLWLPAGLFLFKEPGVSWSGGLAIAAEAVAAGSLTATAGATLLATTRGRPGMAPSPR